MEVIGVSFSLFHLHKIVYSLLYNALSSLQRSIFFTTLVLFSLQLSIFFTTLYLLYNALSSLQRSIFFTTLYLLYNALSSLQRSILTDELTLFFLPQISFPLLQKAKRLINFIRFHNINQFIR